MATQISGGTKRFTATKVYATSDQVIGATTTAAINFDEETRDTGNLHDKVVNNTRMTFPASQAGTYMLHAVVNITGAAAGDGKILVKKNNAATIMTIDCQIKTAPRTRTCFNMIKVVADDYIELFVQNDLGSAVTVNNGLNLTYVIVNKLE